MPGKSGIGTFRVATCEAGQATAALPGGPVPLAPISYSLDERSNESGDYTFGVRPCELPGGSDLPGARVSVTFTPRSGTLPAVSRTFRLAPDREPPSLRVRSTPGPETRVKPGDTIVVTLIADETYQEGRRRGWQTGVQRVQVLAEDDQGFGVWEYGRLPQPCDRKAWRTETLEATYTVPDNPPPILRLRALAEDFAGNHATEVAWFPTGIAYLWQGTVELEEDFCCVWDITRAAPGVTFDAASFFTPRGGTVRQREVALKGKYGIRAEYRLKFLETWSRQVFLYDYPQFDLLDLGYQYRESGSYEEWSVARNQAVSVPIEEYASGRVPQHRLRDGAQVFAGSIEARAGAPAAECDVPSTLNVAPEAGYQAVYEELTAVLAANANRAAAPDAVWSGQAAYYTMHLGEIPGGERTAAFLMVGCLMSPDQALVRGSYSYRHFVHADRPAGIGDPAQRTVRWSFQRKRL